MYLVKITDCVCWADDYKELHLSGSFQLFVRRSRISMTRFFADFLRELPLIVVHQIRITNYHYIVLLYTFLSFYIILGGHHVPLLPVVPMLMMMLMIMGIVIAPSQCRW